MFLITRSSSKIQACIGFTLWLWKLSTKRIPVFPTPACHLALGTPPHLVRSRGSSAGALGCLATCLLSSTVYGFSKFLSFSLTHLSWISSPAHFHGICVSVVLPEIFSRKAEFCMHSNHPPSCLTLSSLRERVLTLSQASVRANGQWCSLRSSLGFHLSSVKWENTMISAVSRLEFPVLKDSLVGKMEK